MTVLTAGLTSCSESNDEVEEYPNWQATNEQFIDKQYAAAKALADGGDTSWKVIRSWSLEENVATHSYDHIIVNVLNNGTGSGCPLYTDSVKVHYSGRLLPSTSYPEGYQFDKSWTGDFHEATAKPAKFAVSGVVIGFATALQHMHIGDKWRVYIPYQLGYGSTSSTIEPYSTLIFDMELVAYYRANSKPRQLSADGKGNTTSGEWIYK